MKYLQSTFTIPPPERVTCCEACVYGRGEHADWCGRRLAIKPYRVARYRVAQYEAGVIVTRQLIEEDERLYGKFRDEIRYGGKPTVNP